jgi:hypothetical protein
MVGLFPAVWGIPCNRFIVKKVIGFRNLHHGIPAGRSTIPG